MSITINVGIPGVHVSLGSGDRTTHADADEHGVVVFGPRPEAQPSDRHYHEAVRLWRDTPWLHQFDAGFTAEELAKPMHYIWHIGEVTAGEYSPNPMNRRPRWPGAPFG